MEKNYMILVIGLLLVTILAPNVLADASLSVSVSKYEPYPVAPGQVVKVWLLVQNIGDIDAKNVVIEVVPQTPLTPYNQDSTVEIPILGAQKDYLVSFNLKVDENAVEGYNNLKVIYSHGVNSQQEKNLEIYVHAQDSTLTIESVDMDPSEISPGSEGKLTIKVKNNAPSTMTDLSMTLQLQAIVGGTIIDLPFAPMDSGTERRVFKLESGQSTEFVYSLKAYPDATSKVYKIPFVLTYYDSTGDSKNKTDYVGVVVNGVPDISVLIEKTDMTMQARSGTVNLKIVNKGVSDIKFLNVILQDSEDFELLSNSKTTYVGNLVSDDYQTVDYRINVKSGAETVKVPVVLQYRDSNNKYYEEKFDVDLRLIDSKKLGTGKRSGGGFLTIVVILLAAGGIWYYFRSRNKKSKKGQFYQ